MAEEIKFQDIEKKWQARWEKQKAFEVSENSKKKKKYYILEMFPYPSGSGLHMGHAFNYTIGDIYARFKRMSGFNVLYPMGYDSLGLPAENAAIKAGVHPKKYTDNSIKNFIKQQKALGLSYDWERMIKTHDAIYYKWDQWIFLKMLEKGIAYRKKAPVNFCPKCNTVLANEQVHNGKCWRHEDTEVEIKHLEQWFFRITEYADELYEKIGKLTGWPEEIKSMQKNWIGKSHGVEIDFEINGKTWKIFTTRLDTIFGVTFMVVSAQHPRLMELVTEKQKKEVEKFLKKIKTTSQKSMKEIDKLDKEGVFTGSYAVNPVNNEKIPVYAGNFVIADYGSGMVMAVPAHDQRDWEFAKKYDIEIKQVIDNEKADVKERAYTESGKMINSGSFNNIDSEKAKEEITKWLGENKKARKVVNFKLRDWLISRQRYWGTPIPVIYCEKCGIVPVTEKDLPVELPEKVKFGKGNPLETNEKWIDVKCPKCGKPGKRETDTMDTFVNSSWYFLRYCDSGNKKQIFDRKKTDYWMPIDMYVGGKEHACMHLIYFRFYTKFLRDLGLLNFDEPCVNLFNQGMLHGDDGAVMSKSRGNVVLPEEISKKYGIDTARLFLVSMASPDKDVQWSDAGIQGSYKFVNKVIDYFSNFKAGKSSERAESKINKAVLEITDDIETFKYNLAVINLRQVFDFISQEKISRKDAESFLKLLSVFCPHICEEIWHRLGNKNFISLAGWPVADKSKINERFEMQDKAIEKLVEDINNIMKIIKEKENKEASKAYVYAVPPEKKMYSENLEVIARKTGLKVFVYAVNDKDKVDPENKAGKARAGKPAIYLE